MSRHEFVDVEASRNLSFGAPLELLETMGLLGGERRPEGEVLAALAGRPDAELLARTWARVGGVSMAFAKDDIELSAETDEVQGPEDLDVRPLVVCRVRDRGKPKPVAMAAFAVSGAGRVADACFYDTEGATSEEDLYDVAQRVAAWLKQVLGQGWGVRTEVYHPSYAPRELGESDARLRRAWLLLMLALKPYLPHVRFADTQSSLRAQCFARGDSLRGVVCDAVRNVCAK